MLHPFGKPFLKFSGKNGNQESLNSSSASKKLKHETLFLCPCTGTKKCRGRRRRGKAEADPRVSNRMLRVSPHHSKRKHLQRKKEQMIPQQPICGMFVPSFYTHFKVPCVAKDRYRTHTNVMPVVKWYMLGAVMKIHICVRPVKTWRYD